jgi:hypothetical protein
VYRSFQIDANRINGSGRLEFMNQLEKWHRERIIQIQMAETAQGEAACGSTRRARKAYRYVFTRTASRTPREAALLRQIEAILFPGGASTQGERNDVDIVFNAKKYGCVLVTNDGASRSQPGGILGNRQRLEALGVQILTDEEAVACVHELILRRDERERGRALATGEPLPDWVGRD